MRVYLVIALGLCGCGSGKQAGGTRAKLSLAVAESTIEQRDTAWTFENTGAIDPARSMATWTITATPGQPAEPMIFVMAKLKVTSTGSVGTPVGNAVVLLQEKTSSGWITRAAHVADTTKGGAAKTAFVVMNDPKMVSLISVDFATGMLELTALDSQEIPPLEKIPPLVVSPVLEPRASLTVGFVATYANEVLKLAPNTTVRIQVGVSFGNAGTGVGIAHNLDIDGSNIVEPDEAEVGTAWTSSAEKTVPALAASPDVKIITSANDIESTGPVTFSDPVFNLGSKRGTASVTYQAGTEPSTLMNCARLIGRGISKTACHALHWPVEVEGEVEGKVEGKVEVGGEPASTSW